LFNINDYKNEQYIQEIIKKCIISNKVNILDYILFNLNKSIIEFEIDIIAIYLININKKYSVVECEYNYIELLKIIIKYHVITNTKLISGLGDKKYTPIEYCIENNLYMTAKILISNSIDILNSNKKDFNLLIYCFEKSNTIIFEHILTANPNIISTNTGGINIFTHVFLYYEKKFISNSNLLFIFLFKLLKHIDTTGCGIELINHVDELNELIGFKILNCDELTSEEKTILFKLIIKHINPLEQNNILNKTKTNAITNYPLIIHSMLLDELEITFMLLNNLLSNNIVKKNTVKNKNCKVYDYYTTNSQININFIPIIFKYIKDNRIKCNKFEENHCQIEITPCISNSIIVFVMCIKFILFYLTNKCDFKQVKNGNYIIDTDGDIGRNANKYIEITISSDNDINHLNTATNISNTSNASNVSNFDTKIYTSNLQKYRTKITSNKNIWVSTNSNNKKTSQLSDSAQTLNPNNFENNINNLYKLGMIDSNGSDLSESDILFEYN